MGSARWRGVWNCPALQHPLVSECPQAWGALTETADPAVRHCETCDRQVHLCPTPGDFVRAAEHGHCVAIPREVLPIGLIARQVGQPSPESVAAFRAELGRLVDWWAAVIERAPGALGGELEYMRAAVAARRRDAEPGAAADGGA
jgi:hypothetical protein